MKWNATLYDNKLQFVSKYGADVVNWLDPKQGEAILDLGCGTGDLTNHIAQLGSEVTGLDRSTEMIRKARVKFPLIPFIVSDMATFDLKSSFDAVFSNAAIHWLTKPDQKRAFEQVFRHLKKGGRFVAELGEQGNVAKVREAVCQTLEEQGLEAWISQEPWSFMEERECISMLEDAGFEIAHIEIYDRPTVLNDGKKGLKIWLKMFGVGWFQGIAKQDLEVIYSEIEDKLYPQLFEKDHWVADYKRLRFKAIKR